MSNSEWNGFSQGVFGEPYVVWHDGPDFTRVREAYREDPVRTLRMLHLGLAARDPLAAEALGRLGDPTVIPALQAALGDVGVLFRIRVAQALHSLTHDTRWADLIAEDLIATPSLEAAKALRDFGPHPKAVQALLRSVEHDDRSIRSHSAESLLGLLGAPPDILQTDLFHDLFLPNDDAAPSDSDRAAWKRVATSLAGRFPR